MEIGVLKAISLTSSFALRQGLGKKWKLMLVMNSVSKLAKKIQGRGLINGKERGERWLGRCFQARAIYNSGASMCGMPCTTCTSHPSNSAFQPWGFIKERLWLNALTRGENTVIDYDLLRWGEQTEVGMSYFGCYQFMERLWSIFLRFDTIMEITWNHFIVLGQLTRDSIVNILERS